MIGELFGEIPPEKASEFIEFWIRLLVSISSPTGVERVPPSPPPSFLAIIQLLRSEALGLRRDALARVATLVVVSKLDTGATRTVVSASQDRVIHHQCGLEDPRSESMMQHWFL